MSDPIDALDPLVPKDLAAPAPAAPGPTAEEKAEALKALAAKQQALAELQNAVDAHTKGGGPIDPAIVDKAEAFGHKINRAALIEKGLLPAPPPEDLDAAPAPAPEVADVQTPLKPEPDPLVHVDGMVVLYNPTPGVISSGYDGDVFSVRALGCDLVKLGAADAAVGRDNSGGPYSKLGVRRLFGPEPRFQAMADESGVTLEDWVRTRNAALVAEADDAYHAVSADVEASAVDTAKKVEQDAAQ
jgi:hypothetical protein